MKKLKIKTFSTIFTILSFSILSFIIVFNFQNYVDQKKSISNQLEMASNHEKKQPKEDTLTHPMDENIKFIDSIVYTVLLDDDNQIKDIINHSNNELSDDDIKKIANNILKNKNIEKEHINNLYINTYSYLYYEQDCLVIIDNSFIQNNLFQMLKQSILILIILEMIIFIVSKLITNWIVKPVKESFEKQKQFIADASHELKTPLSIIIASSEELNQNPNEKKWLKNIEYESNRMNSLISDLLELAASEDQKVSNFEIGDLSKVVELSVLAFEGIAYEKGITLKYEIEDKIKMKMNENNMKQLVEILLDNALKHAKSNVFIKLKQSNNLELFVENDGTPIPKGQEQKIFERFYRVDQSRNRKENRYGLGLAIAKNIVENHQGKIEVYSNDKVTTFKVSFRK